MSSLSAKRYTIHIAEMGCKRSYRKAACGFIETYNSNNDCVLLVPVAAGNSSVINCAYCLKSKGYKEAIALLYLVYDGDRSKYLGLYGQQRIL